MKRFILIPSGFALFMTAVFSLIYKTPLPYALSNGLFWTGLALVLAGLSAIVDILGLFKSFTYLVYRQRIRNENRERLKDNLPPKPVLDMAEYVDQKKHLPQHVLLRILAVGIGFWVLSFLLTLV